MKLHTLTHKINHHLTTALLVLASLTAGAQEDQPKKEEAIEKEEDYYRLFSLPVPEHIILEVAACPR